MDIPLNAEVHCTDGVCGRSSCIIVNPVTKNVTHFVVQTKGFLHSEYMVALDTIIESTPKQIYLRCTREELDRFEPFERLEFIAVDDPTYLVMPPHAYDFGADDVYRWPYLEAESGTWGMYANIEQIPHDELGIRRWTDVEAVDGRIGRVDEFLVNPTNNHISHLVLREGHLWGQKDVTIPVSEIDRMEDDVVYLKLTKKQVQEMPSVPIER